MDDIKYLYDIDDLRSGNHDLYKLDQVELALSVCDELNCQFAEFGVNGYFICGFDYPTPETIKYRQ